MPMTINDALHNKLFDEVCACFADETEAQILMLGVGLKRSDCRAPFGTRESWLHTFEILGNGKVELGIEKLANCAHLRFPANPTFKAHVQNQIRAHMLVVHGGKPRSLKSQILEIVKDWQQSNPAASVETVEAVSLSFSGWTLADLMAIGEEIASSISGRGRIVDVRPDLPVMVLFDPDRAHDLVVREPTSPGPPSDGDDGPGKKQTIDPYPQPPLPECDDSMGGLQPDKPPRSSTRSFHELFAADEITDALAFSEMQQSGILETDQAIAFDLNRANLFAKAGSRARYMSVGIHGWSQRWNDIWSLFDDCARVAQDCGYQYSSLLIVSSGIDIQSNVETVFLEFRDWSESDVLEFTSRVQRIAGPHLRATATISAFRDYFIQRLEVIGPDDARFVAGDGTAEARYMGALRASTTLDEIASEILRKEYGRNLISCLLTDGFIVELYKQTTNNDEVRVHPSNTLHDFDPALGDRLVIRIVDVGPATAMDLRN